MSTVRDGEVVRSMRFTDPDEAASAVYGCDTELSLLSRGCGNWDILEIAAGDSVLVSARMGAPLSAACAVDRDVMSFSIAASDTDRWSINGRRVDSCSLVFLTERSESVARSEAPMTWISLQVKRSSFARSFESFTRRAFSLPDGLSIFAPHAKSNAALRTALTAAARLARKVPGALRNEQIRMGLEKSFLEPLIRAIGCPAVLEDRSHRALAARAQEYLRAHSSSAVYQSDLCAELGIADRTLRRLFAEHFAMSPGRYLRLRRLNQARRALRDTENPVANVTEIGMRYGFFDLGRFAADYRRLFGELPSSVLRNKRAGVEHPAPV